MNLSVFLLLLRILKFYILLIDKIIETNNPVILHVVQSNFPMSVVFASSPNFGRLHFSLYQIPLAL